MNVEGTSGLSLTMIAILAGALLVLIVMLTVAYVYKEFAKAKLLTRNERLTGGNGGGGGGGRVDSPGSPDRQTRTGRQCIVLRRRHHRTILGLYFVFWVVYSLTFTFTVLFALLSMALEADLVRLAQIDAFRRDMRNTTVAASVRIERHGADDLARQSAAAAGMQRACSVYVGELLAGVARRVDDLMTVERLDRVRGANASVSHLFVRRTERHLDEYSRAVDRYGDEYRRRVDAGVSAATAVYYRYLQAVLNSDWFSFPQLLFNASERTDLRGASAIPEQRSGPNVFESGFGSFLEIEEVEDVKLWPIQFWQRSVRGSLEMTNDTCDPFETLSRDRFDR